MDLLSGFKGAGPQERTWWKRRPTRQGQTGTPEWNTADTTQWKHTESDRSQTIQYVKTYTHVYFNGEYNDCIDPFRASEDTIHRLGESVELNASDNLPLPLAYRAACKPGKTFFLTSNAVVVRANDLRSKGGTRRRGHAVGRLMWPRLHGETCLSSGTLKSASRAGA